MKNLIKSPYKKLDKKDIKRIKAELDLQENMKYPNPEYNAHSYLEILHEKNPPKLSFKGTTIDEHITWKEIAQSKLKELVAYEREKVPFNVRIEKRTTYNNIIMEKISFDTAPNLRATGVLCHPKSIDKPLPAIIALHGHNKGKINTLGLLYSKSDSYYGIALALQGFITFSLDQWGWGERFGRYKKLERKAEEVFSRSAMLLGIPALGIRAWDVSRSIDYLDSLDITNGKFGVIGQSGGGAATTYASALDDRINAAVISGHFCSAKYGLLSIGHCTCAYVPGLLEYLDIPDIVSIRVPKPTFIVSGENDPIFPKEGVIDGYKKLKKIYKIYNKGENLGLDIIPNKPHFFRGEYAYPWLREKLYL
jgi:dienelactone hydrolase